MNSNELIEGNFLIPLEAHYGVKAKPGVRLTIIGELQGCEEVTLVTAAAHIKRTRKAMTFPSPAECIAAIRASKAGPVAAAGTVTGRNYGEKVAEFAKASGRDSFPVIQKWADEAKTKFTPEWEVWQSYWEDIGARCTLAIVHDKASYTVPTNWPYEFDANARWSAGDPVAERDAA